MAKYEIAHACGHDETVDLVGTHAERDRKVAWMEGRDCTDCRKAAFHAVQRAKAEAIRAEGRAEALPKLSGTDRQVDWAETVRARLLLEAEGVMIRAEAIVAGDDATEKVAEDVHTLGLALGWLREQAEARYWIDHRDYGAPGLLREAVRAMAAAEQEAHERARADARARGTAEKVRALAVRARELFGSDQEEFAVSLWKKDGERRVYIGHGHGNNWVEYYHTGNARKAPGTLKIGVSAIVRDLAAHLGVAEEDAKAKIREFCAAVARWESIRIKVSDDNAPRDPRCRRGDGWVAFPPRSES